MGILKKTFKQGGAAILALTMSSLLILSTTSCSKEDDDDSPLTLMTYTRGYQAFDKALKEKYPDIEIKYVSYKGKDATDYALTQLRAQDITDIFSISAPPVDELQTNNLYDFSNEEFVTDVNVSIMNNVSIDGGIYLMPVSLALFGIYYNKSLFEREGWSVPKNYSELEVLCNTIKGKASEGYKVAENYNQYTGNPFQFFFDVNAPEYFNTTTGITWMKDFLSRKKTAVGNLEGCVERFQKWIDLGMIDAGEENDTNNTALARFKEGKTAFILPSTTFDFHQNSDGTGDEYGILPFIGEKDDGSDSTIVTLGSSYYGINKKLASKPKKLEKALKVMEFISSSEGRAALGANATNQVPILKNDTISESNPIYGAAKLIDKGQSMTFVQSGWDVYMSDFGKLIIRFTKGELTSAQLLAAIDALPSELPALAEVEEDLEKEDVAQLVGTCWGKATDSDLSLISIGDYHGFGADAKDENGNVLKDKNGNKIKEDGENAEGINAKIYSKVKLDSNVVCTFNPVGWTAKVKQATLTGAKIKEWAEQGFFYKTAPTPFTYKIIKPENLTIEDDKTYKVALSTEYYNSIEDRPTIGNVKNTSVIGQDALVEYITSLKKINKEAIRWTA